MSSWNDIIIGTYVRHRFLIYVLLKLKTYLDLTKVNIVKNDYFNYLI